MTQSDQFHPIRNFSNLFPLKWLRIIQNSQIFLIHSFSNLYQLKMINSKGGGVNYQTQIVNTKLPNEISKPTNYRWLILGGGGGVWVGASGGKLPNTKCEHQITKWKSPNLPSTNDWFWGGGGNLPNANCWHQTTNCDSINHKHYFTCEA